MKNKFYEPVIKEFLGEDVRTITTDDKHEYIVCEDMFKVLGFIEADGTWDNARETMLEFLSAINKKDAYQKLKIIQNDIEKELECLAIEKVFLVMTQFQPKEENTKMLEKWADCMKFLNILLQTTGVKIGD